MLTPDPSRVLKIHVTKAKVAFGGRVVQHRDVWPYSTGGLLKSNLTPIPPWWPLNRHR